MIRAITAIDASLAEWSIERQRTDAIKKATR